MMKRIINAFLMLLFAANAFSQSDTLYINLPKGQVAKFAVDEIYSMGFIESEQGGFPAADNSKDLAWVNPAERTKLLLEASGPDCGKVLGAHIEIEDYQYNEIADFTVELVSGCKTEYEKYEKVFKWLVAEIDYEFTDNRPYSVFKNKKGICQGYADLLNVMLNALGIPCVTANGYIPEGGHAWNYVKTDGVWYLSDPTNDRMYKLSDVNSYGNIFMNTDIQATLFEDEYCTYNYYSSNLNVESIKEGNKVVTIPYSVGGFKITSVNPTKEGSKDVKELYIGKNVETLDKDGNTFGLASKYKSIQSIEVDPANTAMSSYSDIIYKGDDMYFVAPGAKFLRVKPVSLDKESMLKNLDNLECIVFEEGMLQIGAYAIEKCPNLKVAYIPESTSVNESAFYNVHPDFKIIRGEYSGE